MSDGENNASFQSDSFEYNIRRLLSIALRHWRLLLTFGCLSLIAAAISYSRAEPVYRASSSLMLQQNRPIGEYSAGGLDLQGYSEMFASDAVLSASLKEVETMPPELNMSLSEEYWPSELMKILSVEPRRSANIIDLSCSSRDPQACVEVLNAIVQSSLKVFGDAQKNQAIELVGMLDNERRDIEEELNQKEVDLLNAKNQCGDIGGGEDIATSHPVIQRALELNRALITAQQSRIDKQSLLAQVKATLENGGDLLQHLESFEEILGQQFELTPLGMTKREGNELSEIQKDIREKEYALAEVDKYYGPAHPKHVLAREELEKSKNRFNEIVGRINRGVNDLQLGERMVQILQSAITNAMQREQAILAEYQNAETDALALNDQLAKIAMVDREVTTLRNRHVSLLDRIADIDVNSERANVQIMVVSDATLPTSPYSPNLYKTVFMYLVVGLTAAAGLIFTTELFSGRFHSSEQLEHELGHRVIATIGKLTSLTGSGMNAIQSFNKSTSSESEAFRTLRASLGFSNRETSCLAITSSEPGDGKTTVTSNLAVSFAQANIRCLLIDADMRKPGLSKLFNKRGLPGLAELLRNSEDIFNDAKGMVHTTEQENLDFLPCGIRPSDPTALLTSEKMREMLGWAVSQYDQVLIDCPPALVSADASITGRMADGVLLVVNPEKNSRKTVLRANDVLMCSDSEVIGTIINGTDFATERHYYYYNYGEAPEAGNEDTNETGGTDPGTDGDSILSFPARKPNKVRHSAAPNREAA